MEKKQDNKKLATAESHQLIENIINIFSDIDEKIMALHQCSSDDFLSLNEHLKNNYQKAKLVSENTESVIELISEQGNEKYLRELDGIIEDIKAIKTELDQSQDAAYVMVQRLAANLGLLFVPIKNFRQNLMSLKLLLANLKLSNTYFSSAVKGFTDEELELLARKIEKIKESCPVIEENIFNLREHLLNLSDSQKTQLDRQIQQACKECEMFGADMKVLGTHHQENLVLAPKMQEITKNCFQNVGSIITNLQYHDIIRQKMEHIQQTHHKILKDISGIDWAKQDEESQKKKHSYILQIPEISEIQIAQLLHTNKEYQNAIEKITKRMIQMGKDMAEISKLNFSWGGYESDGEIVRLPQMKERFALVIKLLNHLIEDFKKGYIEILSVNEVLKEISSKFLEVYELDYSLEQLILSKFEVSGFINSPEKEIATLSQQIVKLQADNHFEKNKVKRIFVEALHINKDLNGRISEYLFGGTLVNRLRIMEQKGFELFEALLVNQQKIENIQADNFEKSQGIVVQSKQAVEFVKYYDFFEKTIEDVIFELNTISKMMQIENIQADQLDRAATLRQIEAYYTMKSERLVHNMVIDKNTYGENNQLASDENSEEGNDVEFF